MSRLDKIKEDVKSIEYGYDSDLPMYDDLIYCINIQDETISLLNLIVSSFLSDPTHINHDIEYIYNWLKKNDFYKGENNV